MFTFAHFSGKLSTYSLLINLRNQFSFLGIFSKKEKQKFILIDEVAFKKSSMHFNVSKSDNVDRVGNELTPHEISQKQVM